MESENRSGWVRKIAIIGPEEHLHPEILKYAQDCTGDLKKKFGARVYRTQTGGIDSIITLIDPNNPIIKRDPSAVRDLLESVGRIIYLTDEEEVQKIIGDSIAQLEPVNIEELGTALDLPKRKKSLLGLIFG